MTRRFPPWRAICAHGSPTKVRGPMSSKAFTTPATAGVPGPWRTRRWSSPRRRAHYSRRTMKLNVNGAQHDVDVDPRTPLLYVLRGDLKLDAAKFGCGL